MGKNKNIHINFSDISFDKCNDPEHSHPPLSQKEIPDDPEKFVNLDINNFFTVNEIQKCFEITDKYIFSNSEALIESLFKYFSPARSPPNLKV